MWLGASNDFYGLFGFFFLSRWQFDYKLLLVNKRGTLVVPNTILGIHIS